MCLRLSLTFLFIFTCQFGFAVSLTSHRIYLDKDQRTASFVIFNREQQTENCKLSFQDFPFDKAGNMGKLISGERIKTSAANLVRFSPRQFEIKAGSSQTVRFSLRRKANTPASEYQSYLSINCGKNIDKAANIGVISLSPRLVHNVPVIARTGTLNATLDISNIHLSKNGNLAFRLNKSGNRSVYGIIEIINKNNGERVNYLQGISLYVPSNYRDFDFALPKGVNPNTLAIRFIEDKEYGGNLIINSKVNL